MLSHFMMTDDPAPCAKEAEPPTPSVTGVHAMAAALPDRYIDDLGFVKPKDAKESAPASGRESPTKRQKTGHAPFCMMDWLPNEILAMIFAQLPVYDVWVTKGGEVVTGGRWSLAWVCRRFRSLVDPRIVRYLAWSQLPHRTDLPGTEKHANVTPWACKLVLLTEANDVELYEFMVAEFPCRFRISLDREIREKSNREACPNKVLCAAAACGATEFIRAVFDSGESPLKLKSARLQFGMAAMKAAQHNQVAVLDMLWERAERVCGKPPTDMGEVWWQKVVDPAITAGHLAPVEWVRAGYPEGVFCAIYGDTLLRPVVRTLANVQSRIRSTMVVQRAHNYDGGTEAELGAASARLHEMFAWFVGRDLGTVDRELYGKIVCEGLWHVVNLLNFRGAAHIPARIREACAAHLREYGAEVARLALANGALGVAKRMRREGTFVWQAELCWDAFRNGEDEIVRWLHSDEVGCSCAYNLVMHAERTGRPQLLSYLYASGQGKVNLFERIDVTQWAIERRDWDLLEWAVRNHHLGRQPNGAAAHMDWGPALEALSLERIRRLHALIAPDEAGADSWLRTGPPCVEVYAKHHRADAMAWALQLPLEGRLSEARLYLKACVRHSFVEGLDMLRAHPSLANDAADRIGVFTKRWWKLKDAPTPIAVLEWGRRVARARYEGRDALHNFKFDAVATAEWIVRGWAPEERGGHLAYMRHTALWFFFHPIPVLEWLRETLGYTEWEPLPLDRLGPRGAGGKTIIYCLDHGCPFHPDRVYRVAHMQACRSVPNLLVWLRERGVPEDLEEEVTMEELERRGLATAPPT